MTMPTMTMMLDNDVYDNDALMTMPMTMTNTDTANVIEHSLQLALPVSWCFSLSPPLPCSNQPCAQLYTSN